MAPIHRRPGQRRKCRRVRFELNAQDKLEDILASAAQRLELHQRLFAEDSWRNVYTGELEVRLPSAPTIEDFVPDFLVLRSSRSEPPFASSLSRRTISVVLRIFASLSSAPIVEAIARNRALNSR
jgi:hypothetical protein